MEYWKRLSCAAVIAVSAGCSSPPRPPVQANGIGDSQDRPGLLYDDIFNFRPREADSFLNASEIDEAINGLRRRLFFAAGPDLVEGIIMKCESGSGKMLCPVNETQRVLRNVNMFSEAVTNCYSGGILSDGRPDPGAEGRLDLDCFVNTVKAIEPVKGANYGMECKKTLYECYKTGYTAIAKPH